MSTDLIKMPKEIQFPFLYTSLVLIMPILMELLQAKYNAMAGNESPYLIKEYRKTMPSIFQMF
jgi:hypothetical protein